MQNDTARRFFPMLAAYLGLIAGSACVTVCCGTAQAQTTLFPTMQVNGNAYVGERGWLLLTTHVEQSSSAYLPTPFTIDPTFAFTSKFRVYAKIKTTGLQADGFAFVMQNDPAGDQALGQGGACLAICDIQNYAAIAFQTYTNDTAGLWLNGTMTTVPFTLGSINDKVDVTVTYSQVDTTLAYTALNETTGQTVNGSFAVDLSTLGPSVYIGFSGGSGGTQSSEHVVSWSFDYTP